MRIVLPCLLLGGCWLSGPIDGPAAGPEIDAGPDGDVDADADVDTDTDSDADTDTGPADDCEPGAFWAVWVNAADDVWAAGTCGRAVHFDGSDYQYVVAMDKQTGETVWKTDRSVDFQDIDPETGRPNREGDYRKGFSTPVIARVGGRDVLISLGSVALYGYEPETGEELWRVEARGGHSGSSRPVVGHGLVFAPMGLGKSPLWAVRPDGHGVVTDTHVAWEYRRSVPGRSSVLLVDDLLFLVDDGGVAACVEAKTGKELWRARLGGNYSASPIHAGGRIYFFDESGKSTVIEAAPKHKVIAVNRLDDGFMASPAVSGNALYLRTRTALYRIEDRSKRGS